MYPRMHLPFAPSPGEAFDLNPYRRRRARDPEYLEYEYEEEEEGEGPVAAMGALAAYELNPQTYWGAGGGHYHGDSWHAGGGRRLDPRHLPRPPYDYHPGGGHVSHGFHPGAGYNANPLEDWDEELLFASNPVPAYGYGHLPYSSPIGPGLVAAAANPPRACVRCGRLDCPCGCEGVAAWCTCPSVRSNPQTHWGAGAGYHTRRGQWRPGGGRYLDPRHLPRPPYDYHPGGGHRNRGWHPGAGYNANPIRKRRKVRKVGARTLTRQVDKIMQALESGGASPRQMEEVAWAMAEALAKKWAPKTRGEFTRGTLAEFIMDELAETSEAYNAAMMA